MGALWFIPRHDGGVTGFTVSELSRQTGVKVPTIHMYLRRGLLPEPIREAGNRFLYDRRHVDVLRLIRLLRERRQLPLDDIARALPSLLAADDEQAFRPEMWEEVFNRHLEAGPETRLLAAARELFSLRGYAGVGIEDICRQAGVAKGSFYRHFSSKDDVYLAAARSIPAAVGESMAGAEVLASEALALDRLVESTAPVFPLLLEVATRAMHGEPSHAELIRNVMEHLAEVTSCHLPGRRRSLTSGRRAVATAFGRLLRTNLGIGVATS
jgi:AcrR family transcriptional regulator